MNERQPKKKIVLHNFVLNKLAEILHTHTYIYTYLMSEQVREMETEYEQVSESTNKNKFHPIRIGIRSRIHFQPRCECEIGKWFFPSFYLVAHFFCFVFPLLLFVVVVIFVWFSPPSPSHSLLPPCRCIANILTHTTTKKKYAFGKSCVSAD